MLSVNVERSFQTRLKERKKLCRIFFHVLYLLVFLKFSYFNGILWGVSCIMILTFFTQQQEIYQFFRLLCTKMAKKKLPSYHESLNFLFKCFVICVLFFIQVNDKNLLPKKGLKVWFRGIWNAQICKIILTIPPKAVCNWLSYHSSFILIDSHPRAC